MFSNCCAVFLQVAILTLTISSAAEKRYEIHATYETWFNALGMCNRMGGRLARIPDVQTQERVVSLIRQQGLDHSDYWFDLHDLHSENDWYQNNGERQEYFNWARFEPNDDLSGGVCGGGQDCAQLWSARNFQWDDTTCCQEQGVICEFDIETSMSTSIMESDSTSAQTKAPTTSSPTALSSTEQTMSSLNDLCASVSDQPLPKADQITSYVSSSSTSPGNAVNTILLVISIINFIVLLCVVGFLYLYVWRKIRQGVIQAPTYQDLVSQQTQSYKNFE